MEFFYRFKQPAVFSAGLIIAACGQFALAADAASGPGGTRAYGVQSYYTVKADDTLENVARLHGVAQGELATWNRLASPYALSEGQLLLVSRPDVAPAGANEAAKPSDAAPAASGAAQPAALPAKSDAVPPQAAAPASQAANAPAKQEASFLGSLWNMLPFANSADNATPPPSTMELLELASDPMMLGKPLEHLSPAQRQATAPAPASSPPKREEAPAPQSPPAQAAVRPQTPPAPQAHPAPAAPAVETVALVSPSTHTPTPPAVPAAAPAQAAAPAAVPATHTVKKGERLDKIARLHGVDQHKLAEWNRLSPPYKLKEGQTLALASPAPEPVTVAAGDSDEAKPRVIVEYVDFSKGPEPIKIDPPPAYKP